MEVCPECGERKMVGVEYTPDLPEYYDGVSEWYCLACDTRIGRWSGRRLKEGELEKKYGV